MITVMTVLQLFVSVSYRYAWILFASLIGFVTVFSISFHHGMQYLVSEKLFHFVGTCRRDESEWEYGKFCRIETRTRISFIRQISSQ
jgi:hypothetical protein